jgi:hypothetical protein
MLYQLVCPICRFFKRHPFLLRWSVPILAALVVPIVYAKIYQNWDTDPERGALYGDGPGAGTDGPFPEEYILSWQ